MSARTKARKRAIDLLYGADLRELPIAELVEAEDRRAASEPDRAASWAYARRIAEGVDAHREGIDATIRDHAQGWTLERMPVVDRAIARVAVWEIVHNPEVPDGVAISEAVDAARSLSTDDSAGFLNGLLAAVARDPSPQEPGPDAVSADAASAAPESGSGPPASPAPEGPTGGSSAPED